MTIKREVAVSWSQGVDGDGIRRYHIDATGVDAQRGGDAHSNPSCLIKVSTVLDTICAYRAKCTLLNLCVRFTLGYIVCLIKCQWQPELLPRRFQFI